jgi:hypothetical protein
MRQPKPFYRTQTPSFYVQIDGRQFDLGPDEAEAYRRWHLLMAGADESVIAAMNQPTPAQPKPELVTVHRIAEAIRRGLLEIEATLSAEPVDVLSESQATLMSAATTKQ